MALFVVFLRLFQVLAENRVLHFFVPAQWLAIAAHFLPTVVIVILALLLGHARWVDLVRLVPNISAIYDLSSSLTLDGCRTSELLRSLGVSR